MSEARNLPALPYPGDRECLPCYLYRVSAIAPCDGTLRALQHYRDCAAPRATALERKIRMLGGYCDCEVLMNAVRPATTAAVRILDEGRDLYCTHVRRGSIQPCSHWVMRRGVQWGGGVYRPRSA